MSLKIFSVHKRESVDFQNIQDKYSYKKDLSVLALSDGATQALNSALWAEILVSSYVLNPTNIAPKFFNLLVEAAKRFHRELKISTADSEDNAIAGLIDSLQQKGSYCTFVGVEINNDTAKIASYGDSVIFHFRNNILLDSIPVNTSVELDACSNFLNTNVVNNQTYFVEEHFKSKNINLAKDDILILSTDAFSKYIFENQSYIDKLVEINSFNDFVKNVCYAWDKETLDEDDISVMIYKHDNKDNVVKIQPPNNFKFEDNSIPPTKFCAKQKSNKKKWFKYLIIFFVLSLALFLLTKDKFNKSYVLGCMDPTACNYNKLATQIDDCIYPKKYYDCHNVCLNDIDGDRICDEEEIAGCTDKKALNYNSSATDDDGSCVEIIYGCMDKAALNFDPKANKNNGSCKKKINNIQTLQDSISIMSDTNNFNKTIIKDSPIVVPQKDTIIKISNSEIKKDVTHTEVDVDTSKEIIKLDNDTTKIN